MAAALGHHLVLEVSGGDAGTDVEVDGALDVEQVSITRIHVDDDRRDLQVQRLDSLLGIAHGHRELEFAKGADSAGSAIGYLDRGVDVHVSRAEMADREGIAAEVHGIEAVVHHELGAEWVVDTRSEDVLLGREESPEPPARLLVARCGNLETLRKEGR